MVRHLTLNSQLEGYCIVGGAATTYILKMSYNIVYKTLEEIKQEVIDSLNNSMETNAKTITRAHESVFGSNISHSVGEDAPEGKFQVRLAS